MRIWVLATVLVIGCGKAADKPGAASGSGSGSATGSGSGSAIAAAPATPAAPTGPTLPGDASCSGHWHGTFDWYSKDKDCKDPSFYVKYAAFDLELKPGAAGWEATIAEPAGARVTNLDVSWETDDSIGCNLSVTIAIGDKPHLDEIRLSLSHNKDYPVAASGYANIDHQSECGGQASAGNIVRTPGPAGLPPIDPKFAAIVGAYAIDVAWKKPASCPKGAPAPPPAHLAYQVAVDRNNGDKPVMIGFVAGGSGLKADDFYVAEAGFTTHSGRVVDIGDEPEAAAYEISQDVTLEHDKVTGSIGFILGDPSGRPICEATGALTGARVASGTGIAAPPPVKAPVAVAGAPTVAQVAAAFDRVLTTVAPSAFMFTATSPVVTPKDPLASTEHVTAPPVTSIALDGKSAWIASDLSTTGPDAHATALFDGSALAPAFVHLGRSLSDREQAKANAAGLKLPGFARKIAPGAEPVVARFESTAYGVKDFTATVSDREDVVLFGTEQSERVVGGDKVRATLRKWNLAFGVRGDAFQAGISASKTVAWIAANVDAWDYNHQRNNSSPYRLTAIYELEQGRWQIVQLQFSFPPSAK